MIIQKLQQMDCLNLGDAKSLPHYKRPAGNWVQYKMRVAGDGFRDDVYYEIERGRNSTVRGQLHIHSECGRRTSELRDEILRIAHKCEFAHTNKTSQDFKIYGGAAVDLAGGDEDDVINKLCQQLCKLYDAVEGYLCQKETEGVLVALYENQGRVCSVEREKKHLGERNVQCAPNTVVFEPYVGNSYRANEATKFGKRILVVGASHYCYYYERDKGCTAACAKYGKKCDVGDGRNCGEKCELLSKSVIKAYCENDRCVDDKGKEHSGWKRTFTKFTNAFIEERSSGSRIPANSEVFKHLVDVEYVQGVEGAVHNDTNRVLFSAERNFEELKKTIRKMKSEIVVLWGPRVINEVYGRFGKTGSTKDIEEIDFEGRMITLVACRTHPASNDWNADDLRNLLTRVGVRPLKAKQIM